MKKEADMKSTAEALARDREIRTEDINDAIDFLQRKIALAMATGRPISPAAYRSKAVMEMARNIRLVGQPPCT